MSAIEENSFIGITKIDITYRLNIVFIYEDRITLEMGSSFDLPYKIKFIKTTIDEKIDKDFTGKIVMVGNKFAQILSGDDDACSSSPDIIIIDK